MREITDRAITGVKTFRVRGLQVMIDMDLAAFYGVPTKVLNAAVRRTIDRFPEDFMFRLTSGETKTLKADWGTQVPALERLKRNPYAFTEKGIHAISYFLKSPRAIKISIEVIKTFHSIRDKADDQRELLDVIEQLRRRQDIESKRLWDAIRSVRRLEEFREEMSDRLLRGREGYLSEPSRSMLDRIRSELDQIEQRAIAHRELFFLVMLLIGAFLSVVLFFPR